MSPRPTHDTTNPTTDPSPSPRPSPNPATNRAWNDPKRHRGASWLPPVLVLTDRARCAPRTLTDVVGTLVGAGARAIVLREKDLPHGDRAALATELRSIVHDVGGMLVVASDPTIDADGLHLAAADPFPRNRPRVVGRSCHDLDEVLAAEDEGCDYVTLSPIFDSISKPGHRPAGGNGLTLLRSICGHVSLPVFALGGIADWRAAATCIRQGAYGVAALGAVMSDPGSDRTRELLSHTSTHQQEMTL